jgi:protein-L-isoaspartate(D-aspartate) O-methyltransferase
LHQVNRRAASIVITGLIPYKNRRMTDYSAARLNMVESQVRPNKVTDPLVLSALLELPREIFVPERLRGVAYVDEDVPLGGQRYLMEPMVQARLVQAAELSPTDRVLEIGTGTGYGAAVLARIAGRVVALDSDVDVARRAEAALRGLGLTNVHVVTGALALGYPDEAPYNAIVFGGAVEHIPKAITDQLADHGRLVAVVAPPGEPGRATLVTRIGNALSRRVIFDAGTPVLPGCERAAGFAF